MSVSVSVCVWVGVGVPIYLKKFENILCVCGLSNGFSFWGSFQKNYDSIYTLKNEPVHACA